MSKDIKPLIVIYTILILSGWIIGLKHQLNQSHEEKIEIMKIALENNALNQEYISVLQETREALNDELDSQNLKEMSRDLNMPMSQCVNMLVTQWLKDNK